jgi:hypothetical protein
MKLIIKSFHPGPQLQPLPTVLLLFGKEFSVSRFKPLLEDGFYPHRVISQIRFTYCGLEKFLYQASRPIHANRQWIAVFASLASG